MAELATKKCTVCGDGQIEAVAEPGRMTTHHGVRLEIPDDVAIPTCNACGERFYDDETAARVDNALDDALDWRRLVVLKAAIERLDRFTTRSKVEVLLDLSPGYLSKLLKGKKRVGHRTAMLMDFIAKEHGGLEHAAGVFEDVKE